MRDEVIREHIDRIRKHTIVTYCIVIGVMLCMVFGTMIYYELRLRTIVGTVYMEDQDASKILVRSMFSTHINKAGIDMSDVATKAAGYTENGFEYLVSISGQNVIAIIAIILAIMIGVFAIKQYMDTDKKFIYPTLLKLSEENNQLREQLDTSVKYVDKRNRQLQDFIENIAHQVKTPLTALGMAIDMGGSRDECFFHIERIREFIQRLMNISRMESGKVIFAREEINVKNMLKDAIHSAGVDEDKIELTCNDSGYSINGDRSWLKECFINIISNSSDYVKDNPNGEIVINAECRDDKCVITVTDNGPGFDKENINSIFDRFESDKSAGAFHVGIGLNLAKLIVEAHRGTIYASNAYEQQGAQFRVVIPRFNLKGGKSINNI